jgi:FdhD protein
MTDTSPFRAVLRRLVTRKDSSSGARNVPEEAPVAFTYGKASFAVMMATPADLEDFAIGFSLSEGIVTSASDISDLEIVRHEKGVELRMTLSVDRDEALLERRRRLTGPVGCGLCGIESLDQALAPIMPVVSQMTVDPKTIFTAIDALRGEQVLNRETRAVHGAGFWSLAENRFLFVREDVGRHNALDKLCGALARSGVPASAGFVVLTSRVSIDMVQKAARLGAPIVVAVSAPTALAIRAGEESGLTLVGIAREDSFEIFTHPQRIAGA